MEDNFIMINGAKQAVAATENGKRRREDEKEEKLSDEFTIAIDALTCASQIIDSRIANLKEREINVAKRIKEMEAIEKRILDAEARIEHDTHDVITLNVGGLNFSTTKATLLKHKGTFLEDFVKTGQCLASGEKFVDRDPTDFSCVLNFMRDGLFRQKKFHKKTLLEFSFYGILPNEHLTPSLQNVLRSWLPNRKFLEVIHSPNCPTEKLNMLEGPLLIIARSPEGSLFGGYANAPSTSSYVSADDVIRTSLRLTNGDGGNTCESFIFTLTNPHGIPPTRYNLKIGKAYDFSESIMFGKYEQPNWNDSEEEGEDGERDSIDEESESDDEEEQENEIGEQTDLNLALGLSDFPICYEDTTGQGNLTFTGSREFAIADMWVYSVSLN